MCLNSHKRENLANSSKLNYNPLSLLNKVGIPYLSGCPRSFLNNCLRCGTREGVGFAKA